MRFKLLPLLFILIVSCSQKKQNAVSIEVDKNRMIAIQTDIHLLESLCSNFRDLNEREIKKYLFNEVLKKHQISRTEYDKSLTYYKQNLPAYKIILDSVLKRLENRKELNLPGIPKIDSTFLRERDSLRINKEFHMKIQENRRKKIANQRK